MAILDQIDHAIDSGGLIATRDERIDYLCIILKHISTSAATLSDNGHDLYACNEKMKHFSERMKESLNRWDQVHLKKSTIKVATILFHRNPRLDLHVSGSVLARVRASFSVPALAPVTGGLVGSPAPAPSGRLVGSVPAAAVAPAQQNVRCTGTELLKRIQENIGQISLIPISFSVRKAAVWAREFKAEYFQTTTKLFVYLREIENVFWRRIKYLDQPMSLKNLDQIMILLDLYREALNTFVESKHGCVKVLSNRMRSIELLLVWVLLHCFQCCVRRPCDYHEWIWGRPSIRRSKALASSG